MTQRASSERGFTLLELMATLVIIGLLVAIAMASFVGASSNAEAVVCADTRSTLRTAVSIAEQEAGHPPTTLEELRPYLHDFDSATRCPESGQPLRVEPGTGEIVCDVHSR
jgi:prepilin-type N-terminal cleavage/methylation domain-containing protein